MQCYDSSLKWHDNYWWPTAHLENPDVIFCDIQMPGKTGLELVEEISGAVDVVFVTAYDEHAIKAFELNAFDYLLKPVLVLK